MGGLEEQRKKNKDYETLEWIPQGIAGVGDFGKRSFLAVSWYSSDKVLTEQSLKDLKTEIPETIWDLFNAPSLVIVVGEKHRRNLFTDCALAVSYFMMSAVSRGLGTCWVNFGMAIEDPALLEELGISDNCEIVAPVIVGYPENIPAMPPRREPEILAIIPRNEQID